MKEEELPQLQIIHYPRHRPLTELELRELFIIEEEYNKYVQRNIEEID